MCRNVVEAAKRNGTQRKNRRLTVSIDTGNTIVSKYAKADANLKDLRISVIVLLRICRFLQIQRTSKY